MGAEIMRETARSSQGEEIRERRNGSAVQHSTTQQFERNKMRNTGR